MTRSHVPDLPAIIGTTARTFHVSHHAAGVMLAVAAVALAVAVVAGLRRGRPADAPPSGGSGGAVAMLAFAVGGAAFIYAAVHKAPRPKVTHVTRITVVHQAAPRPPVFPSWVMHPAFLPAWAVVALGLGALLTWLVLRLNNR